MAKCENCGAYIDIEFGPRTFTISADSDFFCNKRCENSHRNKCMEAADLPYDGDAIFPPKHIDGYDP